MGQACISLGTQDTAKFHLASSGNCVLSYSGSIFAPEQTNVFSWLLLTVYVSDEVLHIVIIAALKPWLGSQIAHTHPSPRPLSKLILHKTGKMNLQKMKATVSAVQ